jgi:hypothetical protein
VLSLETVLASAFLVGGVGCSWYALFPPPTGDFLTEQTLDEVEKAEAAYRASIDKLTRLAQPKLNASENPAAIAAREKLLVLDAEIDSVRSTVSHNRFNAQLQAGLAVLYRDKQDTLKEILQSAQ